MIHSEDQRIVEIMEVLGQTALFTEDELILAEDYLLGNVEQQELEQLAFRDMSKVSADKALPCEALLSRLMSRGGSEEARRLAQFLFAAGQSTSAALFMPERQYYSGNKHDFFPSEPEKRAAVFAPVAAQGMRLRSRSVIPDLIRKADGDPENIRKALAYQKKTPGGRLVLLGAYFLAKYPDAEQTGVLSEEEDVRLMKEYEDEVVGNLSQIYTDQAVLADWKEIRDAVNHDRVDGRILKMAETGYNVNQYKLQLYGGMSYLNYPLSARLKNVVKVCLRANLDVMQNIIAFLDMRNDLGRREGDYDEIFGIEPYEYIKWAAKRRVPAVLKVQCRRNRECFLEYMAEADFEVYNTMASILRDVDPEEYRVRLGADASRQQAKVIDTFVGMTEGTVSSDVRAYLQGKTDEIEPFCTYGDKLLASGGRNRMSKFWDLLKSYRSGFGYDALNNKCVALMMLCRGFGKYVYAFNYNYVKAEDVKKLFSAAESVKLPLKFQLDGYSDIADSYCLGPDGAKVYEEISTEIFRQYLTERREEMVAAIREADSNGRSLGLKILSENLQQNKAEILKFAQDTAKGVKEELLEILVKQTDWEEDIIGLLSSKKAGDRDVAVRVLTKWNSGKYAALFAEALEKEKNGKVRALLDSALNADGGQSGERKVSREDLVKEIHKGNKKRTLEWAYATPFSRVHDKEGREATEEYLQAILLSYSAMSPCGISPSAAALAGALKEDELAVYMNELFDKWLEAGAESRKRWVLYAASIHGGNAIVEKLRHQIQEWPQMARGAIASEAVQALALSPQSQALLIVDGISRKFKFRQVKAAAGNALEFAASQLGITKEELADRIVPDLGFDEKVERHFDYGERRFTVTITPALEIEVFDENGKKLKNLPAPGKRDDETKAAAAYEEFRQMKKQMKATVGSQKMRLDMALSTERRWSVAAWKNLFVRNPIMHQFAIGLIWGIYEGGKLVESFRYMEDGSFNTEDEEEFVLPEEDGAGSPGNHGAGLSESCGTNLSKNRGISLSESSGTGLSESNGADLLEGNGAGLSESGAGLSESCGTNLSKNRGISLSESSGTGLSEGNGADLLEGNGAVSTESVKADSTEDIGAGLSEKIGAVSTESVGAGSTEGTGANRARGRNMGQHDKEVRRIGLVHPIELSRESLAAWKQQLEDYEIVQPVEQLDRSVYRRTKEEEEQKSLERFGGCIVNDLSLGGKLMGDGWYRGSTQDGGGFYTYYREDPELSLGVELHFSGSYVGGSNDDVTVYEARFYQAGTIKRGSYMYDEAEDKNSYFLKDVPERYFSEIVRQIARATAAGKDRNENWRTERR